MNYSSNENHVRASLFKPSGKWSQDVVLNMTGLYTMNSLHDAIKTALDAQYPFWKGYIVVVLDPCHQNAHPVMLRSHLE